MITEQKLQQVKDIEGLKSYRLCQQILFHSEDIKKEIAEIQKKLNWMSGVSFLLFVAITVVYTTCVLHWNINEPVRKLFGWFLGGVIAVAQLAPLITNTKWWNRLVK